jgi:hypothetical protein
MTTTVEQFYEEFIKPMSTPEQLRLVALITDQLAANFSIAEVGEVPPLSELAVKYWPNSNVYDYIRELPEEQKSSPKVILQLAGTLLPEEAEAITQVTRTFRHIDWEMWEQESE